jgi:hypothetical protein
MSVPPVSLVESRRWHVETVEAMRANLIFVHIKLRTGKGYHRRHIHGFVKVIAFQASGTARSGRRLERRIFDEGRMSCTIVSTAGLIVPSICFPYGLSDNRLLPTSV